eukprot:g11875.t1
MVLDIIVIAGVAAAMLGWNIHVMRENGVCCPPSSGDGASGGSSRSISDGEKVRRRRPRSSSSRRKVSHDREAEARRKTRAMAGGGGGSSGKVVMDPVQELHEEELRGPSSDAGVPAVAVEVAAVNGGGDGGAQTGNPGQ